MWTRAELKQSAKSALNDTYWSAFFATILAAILQISFSDVYNFEKQRNVAAGMYPFTALWVWRLFPLFALFGILVSNVIQVGLDYYFIRNHYGETQLRNVFHGFRRGYLNVVGVQFVTNFIVFLWSLLLIVPGIMAGYKYCMVPYLLSENPEMDGRHARELSAQMTDGQKWNIFVLDWSFIGWYLLGLLCLIVGILLVPPYPCATRAELYLYLRDQHGLKISADSPEGGNPDAPVEM